LLRASVGWRPVGCGTDPGDIMRDLDRLEEVAVEQAGKRFLLRTGTVGCASAVLKAVGIAPLPLVRQLPMKKPPPRSAAPRKRVGRPRRGATPR
jgi:hypothetical protein